MLMTMSVSSADGSQTNFQQEIRLPAHRYADTTAALDHDGMKKCLREHVRGSKLRSAMTQTERFAVSWLMIGIAGAEFPAKQTTIDIGTTRIVVTIDHCLEIKH